MNMSLLIVVLGTADEYRCWAYKVLYTDEVKQYVDVSLVRYVLVRLRIDWLHTRIELVS
jgi:hypothetical protein